jgi:hypothetical protein
MFTLNLRSPSYETVIGFGSTINGVTRIALVDPCHAHEDIIHHVQEDMLGDLCEGDILEPNTLLTVR